MTNPNFILLYVENPTASAVFYAGLLGSGPIDASANFAMFTLDSGFMLGLWARHDVEPTAAAPCGAGELAFSIGSRDEVDATHASWLAQDITILQNPTLMDFGYTFTAQDLDGNRLRVFTPPA